MNPICRFVEKIAAESAVRGEASPPSQLAARHLDRCPKCRKALHGVLAIAHELSTIKLKIDAPNRFADEAWSKLQHAQAAREHAPTKRLALAAGIVVAAAALAVLVHSLAPSKLSIMPLKVVQAKRQDTAAFARNETRIAAVGETKKADANVRTAPSTRTARLKSAGPLKSPKTVRHKRRHLISGKAMLAIRPATMPAKTHTSLTKVAAKSVIDPVTAWRKWGEYYEYRGDYWSAEAAYSRAVAKSSDPSLAFSAGRAAECAGDVAQAVDYYTRILKRANQTEHEPKKGSMLWTEDLDTA